MTLASIGSYGVPTSRAARGCPSRRARPARRLAVDVHGAGRGQEAGGRVLGVEARLDGVAARRRASSWAQRERLAGGDAQLLLDEVDAVDQLGHRVLDLQPRVHLEEEELAGVAGRDELDRAGAVVAARPRERDRGRAHPRAQRGVDDGRRRLLDDLLVAALQRALALAEVHARCRGGRRGPGPRCGAGARGSARRARGRRRTPPAPRAARPRSPPPSSSAARTTRMPLPPPPATALTTTGIPSSARSSPRVGRRPGTPARRPRGAPCARRLSPISSIAAGGGPIHVSPASATARANAAFSRQEAVARVHRARRRRARAARRTLVRRRGTSAIAHRDVGRVGVRGVGVGVGVRPPTRRQPERVRACARCAPRSRRGWRSGPGSSSRWHASRSGRRQRVGAERAPEHVAHGARGVEQRARGRSPVAMPISCSIETRSSVAMLPVAPAGTGQPPSSPKLDSNDAQPASSAASTLASPWPRVLWKCAVSSTLGQRAARRARRTRPTCTGLAIPVVSPKPISDAPAATSRSAIANTRSGGDVPLVGAAEARR